MRASRTKLIALVVASGLSLAADGVWAEDVFWDNATGGDWNTGTNWDTGTPPDASDNAFITLDGTYTVTLDVHATVAGLTLGAAAGTQTLQMVARTLTLSGPSVVESNGVLDMRSSTITITNIADTLTNRGLLRSLAVCRVNGDGTLSNDANGTIRVEGSDIGSNALLTVTNGFTSDGTIELTNTHTTLARSATLNVSSGTLVNANLIDVLEGTFGGIRTFGALIDNQDTINIGSDTTINKSGGGRMNEPLILAVVANLLVESKANASASVLYQ